MNTLVKILGLFACVATLVGAAKLPDPLPASQKIFDAYPATLKAMATTKDSGRNCLQSPISCKISGYVHGSAFRALPISEFVDGSLHHHYEMDKSLKFRSVFQGSKTYETIQIWESWKSKHPSHVWVYAKTKAGKEICAGVYFPFPNSFCYSSSRFPFNTPKPQLVGHQKKMSHIRAEASFFRKNQVEVTLDPQPLQKTYIPVWHTTNSRATSADVYHAGFFFHDCVTGSVSQNVWNEFPEACVKAEMRHPIAGADGKKPVNKRAVDEDETEFHSMVESLTEKARLMGTKQDHRGPQKVICPFDISNFPSLAENGPVSVEPSGNTTIN